MVLELSSRVTVTLTVIFTFSVTMVKDNGQTLKEKVKVSLGKSHTRSYGYVNLTAMVPNTFMLSS